jgi:hypothetical protein
MDGGQSWKQNSLVLTPIGCFVSHSLCSGNHANDRGLEAATTDASTLRYKQSFRLVEVRSESEVTCLQLLKPVGRDRHLGL